MKNKPMKFVKKPVEIEAMLFASNNEADTAIMDAIVNWINSGKEPGMYSYKGKDQSRHAWHNGTDIFIETLEGTMKASVGDWIIRGVKGEHYPCKPDVFQDTYEPVCADVQIGARNGKHHQIRCEKCRVNIIAQCRCPGPAEIEYRGVCEECRGK